MSTDRELQLVRALDNAFGSPEGFESQYRRISREASASNPLFRLHESAWIQELTWMIDTGRMGTNTERLSKYYEKMRLVFADKIQEVRAAA